MENLKRWHKNLFSPADSFSIDAFRLCFGILLIYQVYYYQSIDLIKTGFLTPRILFNYDFLPFIKVLPDGAMKLLLPLMLVSAILIVINKFTRIAFCVCFVCFTYLLLLEKSYYNNHLYLFSLLLFFFIFYHPEKNQQDGLTYLPKWLIFLLRFQLFLVYFIGGIVKLNSDWLIHHQPIKILLEGVTKTEPAEGLIYYLTYGGVLYDLLIGFLLWNKKTFKIAFVLTILFNSSNFFLFNFKGGGEIGSFPIFMICANFLFIDGKDLRALVQKYFPSTLSKKRLQQKKKTIVKTPPLSDPGFTGTPAKYFLIYFYIIIQLFLPMRHFLYPGNVDWTSEGQFFAWRMKSCSKKGEIIFKVKDLNSGQITDVNPGNFINTMQVQYMSYYPDMFVTFAKFLQKEVAQKYHVNNVEIMVDAKISLNGREEQYIIDPKTNLLKITPSLFGHNDWIVPLTAHFPGL